MIKKLQILKGKTKIKFDKNISTYYENMVLGWMKILLLKKIKVLLKFTMK